MVEKISHRISQYMISQEVFEEDYLRICQLGIEVMISTMITTVGILFIGYIMSMTLAAILFCLCFTTVRNYAGGYHARTRVRCNLLSWLEAFCVLWFVKRRPEVSSLLLFAEIVVVMVLLLWLAPLENKNKPLSANKKERNRKWMLGWLLFWDIMAIGIYFYHNSYASVMIHTQMMVMLLVILEKGRQTYEKKREG